MKPQYVVLEDFSLRAMNLKKGALVTTQEDMTWWIDQGKVRALTVIPAASPLTLTARPRTGGCGACGGR